MSPLISKSEQCFPFFSKLHGVPKNMRLGRRLKGTLNRHLKKLKGLRLKKIVKNECEAYRIYLNPSTET